MVARAHGVGSTARSMPISLQLPVILFCMAASALVLLLVTCSYAASAALMHQEAAKNALLTQIERYRDSIVHADDAVRAEQVWAMLPETSFIHPRGHEHGWEEIRKNFYGKTMGMTFSKRDLRLVNTPAIHVYGDAAVVEFNWDFTATVRQDSSRKHTTGRESQVYINMPGLGWRLVQVHYSGPATTAGGKGF